MSVKTTSVCLDGSQKSIAEKPIAQRSEWIAAAVEELFEWESYKDTDWREATVSGDAGDGELWLDVVEMGVEYRTRSTLLKPVNIRLDGDLVKRLSDAEKTILKIRPHLRRKGVVSGIIRSAVSQRLLWGDVETT